MDNEIFDGLESSEYEEVHRGDVKGLSPIMESAEDWVLYLNNYEEFERNDARIPQGAIFIGERGTGKTTVAKYIATESEAMFVNLDEYRDDYDVDIRDLYNKARTHVEEQEEPVVLFQDEFDKRYEFDSRVNPEGNQEARDLMKELDGIEGKDKNKGIFYVGTANELDRDIALLRPGRLEPFEFYTPNREVREELIDLFLSRKDGDFNVDSEALSYLFQEDTTPAEIEQLIESSFFHAAKRSMKGEGTTELTTEDVYEELANRRLRDRIENDRSETEDEKIGRHEIGHYLVAREVGITVPFLTIVPSMRTAGETHLVDRTNVADMQHAYNLGATALGGYVIGKRNGHDPFSGVKDDLEYVRNLSSMAAQVMEMDKLREGSDGETAPIDFDFAQEVLEGLEEANNPLAETAASADILQAMENGKGKDKFKAAALSRAEEIIRGYEEEKPGLIDTLTDKLVEEETLFGKDLERIIDDFTPARNHRIAEFDSVSDRYAS